MASIRSSGTSATQVPEVEAIAEQRLALAADAEPHRCGEVLRRQGGVGPHPAPFGLAVGRKANKVRVDDGVAAAAPSRDRSGSVTARTEDRA